MLVGMKDSSVKLLINDLAACQDKKNHTQRHDLNVFQTFSDTIFTLKEWFLSKKGPKEGERVARGHFHERVGETPVHWLPLGVGITQKPFSVSENGPFENFLRSN